MKRTALAWLFGCMGLALVACGDESDDGDAPTDGSADGAPSDGESGEGAPGDGDDGPGGQCEPTDVPCTDEQIQGLPLYDTKTGGAIVEEGETEGEFWSFVDASAGGINGSAGYTYARFTDAGLTRVDLSDEEALASTEWDIALRRYIVRLNSGVSGPSCVQGARTQAGTTFEGLTELPANAAFHAEQYYTLDTCELVPDTSGIGAPQTVLSSFWTYPGCVSMTNNVYVIALASGRHVKAQVTSYYDPAQQAECDASGMMGDTSSAGHIRLKWAFLD